MTIADTKVKLESGMEFIRLHASDIPEVLDLLRSVWPRQYGATGCPDFSVGYLKWLYGGPDAERHQLLGCRVNGRLVGFKSDLYRRTWQPQAPRWSDSWVSTHLTVDSDLNYGVRAIAAKELSSMHTLYLPTDEDEENYSIAYFEDSKSLSRSIARLVQKEGFTHVETRFQQAILNPRKARAAATGLHGIELRSATDDDWETLAEMQPHCVDALIWRPSAETLRHHATSAPQGETIVAVREGSLTGSIITYVLDWLRDGQLSKMLVAERIVALDDNTLAHLLCAAVNRAEELNLRGAVIENPTALPDASRKMGVMPTPRVMVGVCRSRRVPLSTEKFILDIK